MRFIRRYGRAAIVVRAPGDSTQSSNQPHHPPLKDTLESKPAPSPSTSNLNATSPKKNPGQRLMERVPSYVWQPRILSAHTGMYPESRCPDPDDASSATTLAASQDAPWARPPEDPLAHPLEESLASSLEEHITPTDHGGRLPGAHETTELYPEEMRNIMGGFIRHRLYPLLHPST